MNKKFLGRSVIYFAILVLGVVSPAPNGLRHKTENFLRGSFPRTNAPRSPVASSAQTSSVPPDDPAATKPATKRPPDEQFFIVASIDLQKSQILLKRPTEVTLLARVDDKNAVP